MQAAKVAWNICKAPNFGIESYPLLNDISKINAYIKQTVDKVRQMMPPISIINWGVRLYGPRRSLWIPLL